MCLSSNDEMLIWQIFFFIFILDNTHKKQFAPKSSNNCLLFGCLCIKYMWKCELQISRHWQPTHEMFRRTRSTLIRGNPFISSSISSSSYSEGIHAYYTSDRCRHTVVHRRSGMFALMQVLTERFVFFFFSEQSTTENFFSGFRISSLMLNV